MGIFRTVVSPLAFLHFRKLTSQSIMRHQNRYWLTRQLININQSNNCRFASSAYNPSGSISNKSNELSKKTIESVYESDSKRHDQSKKTAKVLPIVLHQITGDNNKSVAVPYEKEIPQWTETDSVSEATKAMEEFTDDFLKSQKILETRDNKNTIENIDYDNYDEVDNIDEKSNHFVDYFGDNFEINANNNVISFRLDPSEFNHLPISAMNLKFDMEMPDLADALANTKDNESNIIPLGFNAKIKGTVDLDDSKIDNDKLEHLEFDEISHMVSSLAANICAVALQKVIVERNKEYDDNEKSDSQED